MGCSSSFPDSVYDQEAYVNEKLGNVKQQFEWIRIYRISNQRKIASRV